MSIIASTYDAQFEIAAPVVTTTDEDNSPVFDQYVNLPDMPIWGRLGSYTAANSQSRQMGLAGEQQSYVLYKLFVDYRTDLIRGCRVRKFDPLTGEQEVGAGSEVFIINVVPVAKKDHLVCVCEELQEGMKVR